MREANYTWRRRFGEENKGKKVIGFWDLVHFTDEAHFNPQERLQKPRILRKGEKNPRSTTTPHRDVNNWQRIYQTVAISSHYFYQISGRRSVESHTDTEPVASQKRQGPCVTPAAGSTAAGRPSKKLCGGWKRMRQPGTCREAILPTPGHQNLRGGTLGLDWVPLILDARATPSPAHTLLSRFYRLSDVAIGRIRRYCIHLRSPEIRPSVEAAHIHATRDFGVTETHRVEGRKRRLDTVYLKEPISCNGYDRARAQCRRGYRDE
ncbi:hypothetical protein BU26DRAFT_179369 [Trematosphaeria pertusa]|uniref:Uncharacterized protein n=1 Tax=Trematosphaeria pertusa TaxID=390896 RepID=A0A6A6HV95_9PLEO|nr:uncharacterized protein BU26DRAFT_179369 [Trematosphaeria pertusa]KAF2241483.1 hypothetical protein BU26DRAFT_179369 [Trematosphaeria pertusa]